MIKRIFKKIFSKIKKIFCKAKKEANVTTEKRLEISKPKIAICDESVVIYSLDVLKEMVDHIYLPKICYRYLINVANGKFVNFSKDDFAEQIMARNSARHALEYIQENEKWCSIIPDLDRFEYSVNIEEFEPKFKTRVIVSLACLYHESGYDVCIYTKTRDVRDCASLQPDIEVRYIEENIVVEE